MLKPQDVMVLAWLVVHDRESWRYADLAAHLALSPSECHAAVRRLVQAGLVHSVPSRAAPDRGSGPILNRQAVLEFLLHGVPHAYFAERGPLTRGIATGVAAPPLNEHIQSGDERPVWAVADGDLRGYSIKPLYRTAPDAARRDARLYEILALIDALREGRARERKLAGKLLRERIESSDAA